MTNGKPTYGSFNVLEQSHHWDEHTRNVVEDRLTYHNLHSLTVAESETLFRVCATLMDDSRSDVISQVVHHFDNLMQKDPAEPQREKTMLPLPELIQQGLKALNRHATITHHAVFAALSIGLQKQIVQGLFDDTIPLRTDVIGMSARGWIRRILYETVSAYYSQPTVWSEIGYAGPAYPRGYVRIERGLADPWEATRTDGQ